MKKLISDEQVKMFENCSERAKALMLTFLLDVEPEMRSAFYDLSSCESPIEEIFRVALGLMLTVRADEIFDWCDIFTIPQAEIECAGQQYRADFYVYGKNRQTDKTILIDVECDGHEFHAKTKEQVQNDNEREYDIKLAGFDVLRFSGSQIYNTPTKCANDLISYIIEKLKPKEDEE